MKSPARRKPAAGDLFVCLIQIGEKIEDIIISKYTEEYAKEGIAFTESNGVTKHDKHAKKENNRVKSDRKRQNHIYFCENIYTTIASLAILKEIRHGGDDDGNCRTTHQTV